MAEVVWSKKANRKRMPTSGTPAASPSGKPTFFLEKTLA